MAGVAVLTGAGVLAGVVAFEIGGLAVGTVLLVFSRMGFESEVVVIDCGLTA